MSEVRIENVYKRFEDITTIHDLNLHIKDGEFTSLLGPSGCGKTTTLRMIAGFERASEGNIWIGDKCVFSEENKIFVPPEKRGIGMVFQSYAVWPHMNVKENVGYPLKIKKVPVGPREEAVARALEMVHLAEYGNRLPSELSGGQQQRVALARALVAKPDLLLLDEPLSNLDAKLRESMRFEIKSLQKQLGITVIYVTHDQSEAMTMSDRVVVIDKGVIQQVGTPHDIYTNPANKMVADFIGLVNFLPGTASGNTASIDGVPGEFSNPDTSQQGEVTIAIRPENISINREGGMASGIITEAYYLGDAVDYRINVNEYMIRVIVKGEDLNTHTIGEKVYLNFSHIMVFNRN